MDWRAHRVDFFKTRTYYSADNNGGFGPLLTMFCWDGSTTAMCSEYPYDYNGGRGEKRAMLSLFFNYFKSEFV